MASGIILYKPELNATDYGFAVPHAEIAWGLGTFGAITGLFVGCPTCAGTAFTMLFGLGASATGVTLFLTSYEAQLQTLFIVISIPILLFTPLLMARKIRSHLGSCALDSKQ